MLQRKCLSTNKIKKTTSVIRENIANWPCDEGLKSSTIKIIMEGGNEQKIEMDISPKKMYKRSSKYMKICSAEATTEVPIRATRTHH